MTITTSYKIFFPWEEYETQLKFEQEHPAYKKLGEDSLGTTYEYRYSYMVNLGEEDGKCIISMD